MAEQKVYVLLKTVYENDGLSINNVVVCGVVTSEREAKLWGAGVNTASHEVVVDGEINADGVDITF